MYIKRQLFLTLMLLVAIFFLFEFSSLDLIVEDFFFDTAAADWFFPREKAHWLGLVFYTGVKSLIILVGIGFILAFAFSFLKSMNVLKKYRRGIAIVCLSMIMVPTIVGILKTTTNTPCPCECDRYGGEYPYIRVLDPMPGSVTERFRCYPAGHASGGFALMSLWFLFKRRRNKTLALGAAFSTGWMMGFYKMAIGDHYLSHTLATMLLSWLIILLVDMTIRKTMWIQSDQKECDFAV